MTIHSYLAAYQGYDPEPDHEPHYQQFLRAYYGTLALGAPECWAHAMSAWIDTGADPSEQYRQTVLTLRAFVRDMRLPPDPYYRISYAAPPSEPTEREAWALWEQEYRAKFPGRRINSKHAKASWASVSERALALVRDQHRVTVEKYAAEEAAIKTENEHRRDEWLGAIHAQALLEDWARGLNDAPFEWQKRR